MSEKLNNESLILWFDDLGTGNKEYRFLSNFYEGAPIILPGITWERVIQDTDPSAEYAFREAGVRGPVLFKTGEHAFAAMKFWSTDLQHFHDIVTAHSPGHAKSLGRSRMHPLRDDWEVVKLDVMAAITRAKYTLDREEGPRLLNTGDRLLVEGTWWSDSVWGVDLNEGGFPGRNWLGSLLMTRRAELRAAQAFEDSDLVQHFTRSTVKHNTEFGVMR